MVYDHAKTIANSSSQSTVTVAAGSLHSVLNPANPIIAVQTKGALIDVGSSKLAGNPNTIKPIGFIPLGGTASLSQERRNATAAMIQSADNGLFGAASASATAMALGAVYVESVNDASMTLNYYEINSCSGSKYTGYSLKIPLNSGLQGITAANDDLWSMAA